MSHYLDTLLRKPGVLPGSTSLEEARAAERMSYRGFQTELLMAECDDRTGAARRIKVAGSPAISRCGPGTSTPTEQFGGPAEAQRHYAHRYHAASHMYIDEINPAQTADFVIDNDDPSFPRLHRNSM